MNPLPPNIFTNSEQLFSHAGPHLAQASMPLLGELEASFTDSQNALLSRDIIGVEQGTREQMRLRQALEILWMQREPLSPERNVGEPYDPRLASEMRAAQMRVLHLGRVQAALLARAQRSLRMISHMMAGPQANYAPPENLARRLGGTRDERPRNGYTRNEGDKGREESSPCPA